MPDRESVFRICRFRLCLAAILAVLACLGPEAARAASLQPVQGEMLYRHKLRHTIAIPRRVNLNRAGLSELMTLPGMDESTALKILRSRPITSLTDLLTLPGADPRESGVLLERVRGYVGF